MNFCPHCGEKLAGDTSAQLAEPCKLIVPDSVDLGIASPDVLAKLRPKVVALTGRIDSMSEDEYGDWVNALPSDEFLAFMDVGSDKDAFHKFLHGPAHG
ncbi:hypothetical protein ACTOWA_00460 [Herbaspirillum seropedicae]|uniref:hypothetical protein n=1 Tax=Herbaspirillum seropedicae TaxID=964 RepID=UPI00285C34F8|nr:hypothetical protein [Herbaspirillum seropedicae]MDR6397935.1 hypothetical protein [Herbaspirillum seropedicae]